MKSYLFKFLNARNPVGSHLQSTSKSNRFFYMEVVPNYSSVPSMEYIDEAFTIVYRHTIFHTHSYKHRNTINTIFYHITLHI